MTVGILVRGLPLHPDVSDGERLLAELTAQDIGAVAPESAAVRAIVHEASALLDRRLEELSRDGDQRFGQRMANKAGLEPASAPFGQNVHAGALS